MTGNFIIAFCTASQSQYADGARGSSEPVLTSHAKSAAALLNESAAVPCMPDHQEDSAAFKQGEPAVRRNPRRKGIPVATACSVLVDTHQGGCLAVAIPKKHIETAGKHGIIVVCQRQVICSAGK